MSPLVKAGSLWIGIRASSHCQVPPFLMVFKETFVEVGFFTYFQPKTIDYVLFFLGWFKLVAAWGWLWHEVLQQVVDSAYGDRLSR